MNADGIILGLYDNTVAGNRCVVMKASSICLAAYSWFTAYLFCDILPVTVAIYVP